MSGPHVLPPGLVRVAAGAIVLAALAATFLAIVGGQRTRSESAAAARNLQQWGIALNLYLIENGNQLPEVGRTPVTDPQPRAWFNALPPYISEAPLADLQPGERPRPGVPSLWIRPGTKPVKIWDPGVYYFSYGMNAALQPDPEIRSFRIYEINFPANVVFLAPIDDYSPAAVPGNVVFSKGRDAAAHILFCDGHVQSLPRTNLLAPAALSAAAAEAGVSWFQR